MTASDELKRGNSTHLGEKQFQECNFGGSGVATPRARALVITVKALVI